MTQSTIIPNDAETDTVTNQDMTISFTCFFWTGVSEIQPTAMRAATRT